MLDQITAAHFAPLQNKTQALTLPDGSRLSVRVDSVKENPRARMPHAPTEQRAPFTVTLTALQPTDFMGGPCVLELATLGQVEGIWVGRLAALGRDQAGAYFQIIFN